jgi:hypothetical protein
MPTEPAPPEFHLHFEGEGTRDHTVPATVLLQAIQALQRAVNLLAVTHEGREFSQRLRVSHEFERKYAVVFKVPENGGYDIPYVIGSTATALFDPHDIANVTEQYRASLAAVQSNDFQALKRIIPQAAVRRQYITALKNMQPQRRWGLVVSIEDARRQKMLDGHTAASRLAPMLNEPVAPSVQPRIVTGRLDSLDFQARNLTLTLSTGRRLTCTYGDDFEPVLLENPREWIQVRGEAILNEDDSLKALNNVSEIVEVDASPVAITGITADGKTLSAAEPLSFPVSFDPQEGIYIATGDFSMLATGETRDELEKAVADALEFLWREYVASDPALFSHDALALRDHLVRVFSEVTNAD